MKRLLTKEELYKLYWGRGLSTYKIAEIYGVSYQTILYYLKKYGIPTRKRPKPPEPNLTPSKELAYVLGVLYGDGTVSRCRSVNKKLKKTDYRYVIQLAVVDRKFAEEFLIALTRIGLRPKMYILRRSEEERKKGHRDRWLVVAQSKKFYNWFKELTLADLEKIVEGYEEHFIRGFYESEGCLDKCFGKKRIRITNTNKNLIMMACKMLVKLGFKPAIYTQEYKSQKKRKTAYTLHLYGDRVVDRFLELVRPCIKKDIK